jgi:hypothetical protein
MNAGGIFAGLVALFILTIVYIMFDPIQQSMHDASNTMMGGDIGILDMNLSNWRLALPLMLLVILLFVFQQGRRTDTYEMYKGF